MALYGPAIKKLLPENETQARITPRAIIVHSAGGGSELYGWWQNPDSRGLESHFWVGPAGQVVQYIDTTVRADANGEANSYAISIETASTVQATEEWPPLQRQALVDLLVWLCDTHSIPRRQMPTATSAGIGWHVMFGAPGPWTKSRGKVCPGPKRIVQLRDEIIPQLAAGKSSATPIPPIPAERGPLMALSDDEQKELLAKVRALDVRSQQVQAELFVGVHSAEDQTILRKILEAVRNP